jgi:hypothetical protein
MMRAKNARLQARLSAFEEVRRHNKDRLLLPREVVEHARNQASPLHGDFEWNDSAAADEYRLIQARRLITEIEIVLEENSSKRTGPAYVSLVSDRRQKGGGYRAASEVVTNHDLREQLLYTVAGELHAFRERWQRMSVIANDLAPLYTEIEAIERKAEAVRGKKRSA